ncbi:hypothetical protein S1OALGB6SA_1496 [Olavius algarvensis spirochete endosymbiont]|nr:hypothetical protein S1OALGB6SA_1496 [Olavius algarvensis spirochete endosymbiont]
MFRSIKSTRGFSANIELWKGRKRFVGDCKLKSLNRHRML